MAAPSSSVYHQTVKKTKQGSLWKNRPTVVRCSECGTEESSFWKPKKGASIEDRLEITRKEEWKQKQCLEVSVSSADYSRDYPFRRSSSRQAVLRQQALKQSLNNNGNSRSGSSEPQNNSSVKGSLSRTRASGAVSRRSQLFKPGFPGFAGRKPLKAPKRRATVVTADCLWHNGLFFRVGDVVSLQDNEDMKVYFARLRGLLSDPYCERFATVTWLLPTTAAPSDGSFDPETFVIGPADETMYPLDVLEFVCSSKCF